MTTAYVLIIISWLAGPSGYVFTTQAFTTQARCEEAARVVLEGGKSWAGLKVTATCVPQ